VIAHQIAKDAAEPRQLRSASSALSGSAARSAHRIVSLPFMQYLARSSASGLLANRSFPYEQVEESIYDAGTVKNRRS
jgi:hypothetical protein